jgi:hypothetical protein
VSEGIIGEYGFRKKNIGRWYLGVKQDLHQITASHDEFGDQVDIPVAGMSEGVRRVGSFATELGEKIGQAQWGGVRPVVVVSVQVKNPLSVDREKSTDDTLGQTSSHDDGIIFTIYILFIGMDQHETITFTHQRGPRGLLGASQSSSSLPAVQSRPFYK